MEKIMKPEDVQKAIADIVGPQWVSTDPCMTENYAYYMNPEFANKEGGRFLTRPIAAVLPKTTEEVSKIMKLCNRADISVKPISTGWHAACAASRENVVVLDLKRMDKIIDIDVKNQIAVVEPYVKAINLQTHLWKEGLNLHVISSGGNHSPLASITAAWGYGLTGPGCGFNGRNLMGAEWVLPTGDIMTLGSWGDGLGWFSAEGPGPSLRGIMRGVWGSCGGFGVFTKCGIKLYNWDGPADYEYEGHNPDYIVKDLPTNIGFFNLSFQNKEDIAEAGYRMGEAGITYADFRLGPFYIAQASAKNALELKNLWESGVLQKMMGHTMNTVIIGHSRQDFEWKVKVLYKIIDECNGVRLPMSTEISEKDMKSLSRITRFVDDPVKLLNKLPFLPDLMEKLSPQKVKIKKNFSDLFLVMLRHATNTKGNFKASGGLATCIGTFDTWDLGLEQMGLYIKRKREAIEEGHILDDGGDLGAGGTYESGHMGYIEGIILYNPGDPKSNLATAKLV
jgi:glycolate oxidase